MDRRTQNKINSADATRDVLADDDNQAAINSNQGFKDAAEEFRDMRAVLQPFLQAAAGDTKGITVNKARLRDALIKKAVALAGGGFAYARKVGNAQMETTMDSNKSDRTKMRGGDIETHARKLHDDLKKQVDADTAASSAPATPIGDYQVNAAALTAFQTNIDALSLVEQGPRAAKGMIKGANEQIGALVEQMDGQKETLKRLLPQLEDAQPQFVGAMKTAMAIVDTAAGHETPKPNSPKPGP